MPFIFLFICLCACRLQAQPTAKINAIQAMVKQTDSALHTYHVKPVSNLYVTEATDNGIEVTGYFNVRDLKKITETVGLSSCWRTYNYYLQDGKPVYLEVTADDMVYNPNTQSFRHDSVTRVFTYHYYFENYSLLYFTGKGTSRCGTPQKAEADDLMLRCKRYVYLLKQ